MLRKLPGAGRGLLPLFFFDILIYLTAGDLYELIIDNELLLRFFQLFFKLFDLLFLWIFHWPLACAVLRISKPTIFTAPIWKCAIAFNPHCCAVDPCLNTVVQNL